MFAAFVLARLYIMVSAVHMGYTSAAATHKIGAAQAGVSQSMPGAEAIMAMAEPHSRRYHSSSSPPQVYDTAVSGHTGG